MYEVKFADNADPIAVAKFQLQLAKFKPRCMNCGHALPAKIVGTEARQVCIDRQACLVRRAFRRCTHANAA